LHVGTLEKKIAVKGCGRTDAGVTAEEYFAQFDFLINPQTPEGLNVEKLRHSLNGILPKSICVTHLSSVEDSFDALESVKQKTYRYKLLFRRAKPTSDLDRLWWFATGPEHLNWEVFERCIKIMQGTHDFRAFMAAHSSAKTTQRTIREIRVEKEKCSQGLGLYVLIHFTGPGFLKHMIRNCVGFLSEALIGKKAQDDLLFLLGEKEGVPTPDRVAAGICAPARGLVLEKVEY